MWKPEHRLAADRRGLRYPSDLTDAEWAIVAPMIPPGRHGSLLTRLEQRGGVALAFMAAAPWIMLLIAAAILAETDRCLITSRTLPQSRI